MLISRLVEAAFGVRMIIGNFGRRREAGERFFGRVVRRALRLNVYWELCSSLCWRYARRGEGMLGVERYLCCCYRKDSRRSGVADVKLSRLVDSMSLRIW